MKNDAFGDRMKAYENVNRNYLMPRMPIIIRVDGKAFHTLTRQLNCDKPFDKRFTNCMFATAPRYSKKIILHSQIYMLIYALKIYCFQK